MNSENTIEYKEVDRGILYEITLFCPNFETNYVDIQFKYDNKGNKVVCFSGRKEEKTESVTPDGRRVNSSNYAYFDKEFTIPQSCVITDLGAITVQKFPEQILIQVPKTQQTQVQKTDLLHGYSPSISTPKNEGSGYGYRPYPANPQQASYASHAMQQQAGYGTSPASSIAPENSFDAACASMQAYTSGMENLPTNTQKDYQDIVHKDSTTAYEYVLACPGFKKDDLKLTFDLDEHGRRLLFICGELDQTETVYENLATKKLTRRRVLDKSIVLPSCCRHANPQVTATMRDERLTIIISKDQFQGNF